MSIRVLWALPIVVGAPLVACAQPPSPFAALKSLGESIEDSIREASQDNNRPSMALIDRERARSMSYDNQIKHTKTYFEKRKLNRAYRAAEHGPTITESQARRYAKMNAPDRLSVQQYDSFGGRINWPVLLRNSVYDRHRDKLNELYASHARQGGGINTTAYAEIETVASSMEALLKQNFNTSNQQQFIYSQRFLASLKYEARFPVGS